MEKFRFEIPSIERKQDAIEYINEFIEYGSEINGTGGLDNYVENYEEWLEKLNNEYKTIPSEERVPAKTFFFVRENDNKIIGMINIRLTLNERLKKYGGHIGYSIRPTERQKGYNKINLFLGLQVCQEHGIKEVLMECDKENLASAKTMLALGGKLAKEWYDDEMYNTILQHYIINVDKSLDNNRDLYKTYISDTFQNIREL